jgi:uncharacterized protein
MNGKTDPKAKAQNPLSLTGASAIEGAPAAQAAVAQPAAQAGATQAAAAPAPPAFASQATPSICHIFRPAKGTDLLKEVDAFVRSRGLNLAWLAMFGAVSPASLRFYQQDTQTWKDLLVEKEVEVVSALGNVSLLNGEPIVHVHMVVSDDTGACFGGHLAEGTIVFNMEIVIQALSGPPVIRKLDGATGLTIWQ